LESQQYESQPSRGWITFVPAIIGVRLIGVSALFWQLSSRAVGAAQYPGPNGFVQGATPAWVEALQWTIYLIPVGLLLVSATPLTRLLQSSQWEDVEVSSARRVEAWGPVAVVIAALAAAWLWPDAARLDALTVSLIIASFVPVFTFSKRSSKLVWLLIAVFAGCVALYAAAGASGGGGIGSLVYDALLLASGAIQVLCLIAGLIRGLFPDEDGSPG